MKQNFDHLTASLRQVGVIITATGMISGIFNTDQWILSVATGLLGLIFIWAASWEK